MQKECAIIAITKTEELKSLGIVHIKSYMLMECAKIVTLINTIKWKGKGQEPKKSNILMCKPKSNKTNHDFTLIP